MDQTTTATPSPVSTPSPIEQWFPGQTPKRPKEFTYKSTNGIWYKSEAEFHQFMSQAH